ncbi:TIGR02677 family protein [Thiorhodococcus minor]|uniref:TIGR02677 family protein n=1 Tax=Thiorhodococcus minor TaxID=57489 RepID=A0A6M0K4S6_9GAMM|nr:TIGR02677 family protein [Thiorhodococcus minor]NEV63597.1 TIGR02677 family protein [Thiorhodococcus minor]
MPDTSFNYLTADKTDLYRTLMRAFSEAKEHFLVHLRPEDVLERATRDGHRLQLDAVQAALGQLVEWGNLQAEPDTSRVTTVEDFYRARYLYQITREGEAAQAALATYERMLGHQGALQSVALADIAGQLRALRTLLDSQDDEGRLDSAKAHLLLRDITRVFTDLADNARDFMAGLARGIDLRRAERAAFIDYKDRLLDYLRRFIGDLVTRSAEIAGLILDIQRHPAFRSLLERIAERDAADLAPAPGLDGAEPVQLDPALARAKMIDEWQARWSGLEAWFIGAADKPSQAELLRSRARRAISDLVDAVVQLNERRLGRSDRSADYRTLAAWFMDCETDAEAHRLWRAAFGLTPARHLGIDGDSLQARAEEPVPPSRPWAEAPPLRISARLRETGSHAKRGVPPTIRDRSQDKQKLRMRLAQESLQARDARRRLATGEEMRLSEIGRLDPASFALFLRLLGEALAAAPNPEKAVETITGDGAIRIFLEPLGPETRAVIETPDGAFGGRDYRVCITDLETGAGRGTEPPESPDDEVAA